MREDVVPLSASTTETIVVLQTNFGNIKIELNPLKAPETCTNFLGYVKEGFYDGTIFHRVISNFMIQGGGFLPDMSQKEGGATIDNEARNGLSNEIGSIAMARTSAPHSASNQFFINVANNTFLDHRDTSIEGYGYCVFGKVIEGMEVVNSIKVVSTGRNGIHQDVPHESVLIEKAYLVVDKSEAQE